MTSKNPKNWAIYYNKDSYPVLHHITCKNRYPDPTWTVAQHFDDWREAIEYCDERNMALLSNCEYCNQLIMEAMHKN